METSAAAPRPLWMRLVIGRRPGFTFLRIVLWALLAVLVLKYVLIPIRVQGTSMFPTYRDDTIHFVNKFAYAKARPERGDIVAVRLPAESYLLLKRIIGMPGEKVQIARGKVIINGEPYSEPYITTPTPGSGQVKLKEGEYLIMGDNRAITEIGVINEDQIVGKVVY